MSSRSMITTAIATMELGASSCRCARRDLSSLDANLWHVIFEKKNNSRSGRAVSCKVHKIQAAGGSKGGNLKESTSSKPRTKLFRRLNQDEHESGVGIGVRRGIDRFSFSLPEFNSAELRTKLLKVVRKDDRSVTITPTRKSKLGKYVAAVGQVWTSKDFPSALCAAAESVITLMEPVQRPWGADPAVHLADNFAPVPEFPPSGFCLEVEGTIPAALNGVYIRNGSNPQFIPTGGYHQFDGDGMLHAIRMRDGRASYCCRYVRTHRFLEESKAGVALVPKALGELYGMAGMARLGLFGLRRALGVISQDRVGIGCANAGLAFHDGRLLAMSEDDMPYAVHILDDGDLETLGRLDFNGKLSHAMTAHPKVDRTTGELFAYGYNLLTRPYLKYFRVSSAGEMSGTVNIDRNEPTMFHDFVVTENYAVFPEPQIVFRLERMIYKSESPIVTDELKVSQIGVMPKYDTDASRLKWFDMPLHSTCFHFVNGWDEGDEVVLLGSCMMPLSRVFSDPATVECSPTEFRLNIKTGQSSKRQLTTVNCDLGGINPLYAGRKNRYMYLSTSGPWPKMAGVVKLDLLVATDDDLGGESRIVARRQYPPGCYGSEPFFVPRSDDPDLAEDDGFLVTYIHDENTGTSKFLVMDAQSPSFETVASVQLPGRVPYGFHGIFLNEEQLGQQNPIPLYERRLRHHRQSPEMGTGDTTSS